MFRQIQYSWQSYDPLYFSFPKHDFMSNVPVYPSEYLLMVLMLKTLLELTFIPLTLHVFQNKNLRKKKTTINLFTSQVLPSSQKCLLSLNFMQIKTSSKDPTDYANGLEKQELQQQVKKGRSLVTENPAPKRAPRRKAVATPPPQPQPPAFSTHPNRRGAEQSAAGVTRTALCSCRVTLATRPQFPRLESEARPSWPPPPGLWVRDSRPPSSRETTALSPRGSPPLPRVAPPPRPRPRGLPAIWETNASATRDMAAARPWTRACAPRPSAPSRATSAAPTQFTSLADSTLGHAETSSPDAAQPARLPPGRP